jgi:hypothetical protein
MEFLFILHTDISSRNNIDLEQEMHCRLSPVCKSHCGVLVKSLCGNCLISFKGMFFIPA